MNKQKTKAFTLVELIVVITILAILGTIAFISLQGYSKDARDSSRISDLSNINLGLEVFRTKAGIVPLPDDKIDIIASGTIVGYQGNAGKNILENVVRLSSKGGKDPLDNTYYTYRTDVSKKKYELLGFLEGDLSYNNLINQTYALDLSQRIIKVKGDDLGVLLGSIGSILNTPIQTIESIQTVGNIDIINYSNDDLKLVSNGNIEIEGTGLTLFSNIITRDENLLNNNDLLLLDDSLIGYWDMETTTLSGATTVLKDLSKYGNNGYLTGGISVGGVDGVNGNATYFDGDNDLIEIFSSDSLNPEYITISAMVNHYGTGVNTNNYPRIISKGGDTNSEEYALWYSYKEDATILNIFQGRLNTLTQSGTTASFITEVLPINNRWLNITIVYDGVSFRSYINGQLSSVDHTVFKGPLINSIKHLIIGNAGWDSGYNRTFYGLIDDIRIYNRGLSDTEVGSLYNSIK